jgi:hypothetical protein
LSVFIFFTLSHYNAFYYVFLAIQEASKKTFNSSTFPFPISSNETVDSTKKTIPLSFPNPTDYQLKTHYFFFIVVIFCLNSKSTFSELFIESFIFSVETFIILIFLIILSLVFLIAEPKFT